MQIPKAVAEKAVWLALLSLARALWACKPHSPQQRAFGNRKSGSMSPGKSPCLVQLPFLILRAQTCKSYVLRAGQGSQTSSTASQMWAQTVGNHGSWSSGNRKGDLLEAEKAFKWDPSIPHFKVMYLHLSDPYSDGALTVKADKNLSCPLPPLFTKPTTKEGISALVIQFFVQAAYTVKFILI